jgi:5,10-methylenetetrahydrofolate reductase
VNDVPRDGDLTATALIRRVKQWAAPQPIAAGAVVHPFADDLDRELALLERTLDAGAEFVQSQMTSIPAS